MKEFVLAASLATLGAMATSASGDVVSFDEMPRLVPGLNLPGFGGFAVADFDGDGHEDVAVQSLTDSSLFEVVGATADGIGIKQVEILPPVGILRLLAHRIDGVQHLFVQQGRALLDYSGWPLARVRTLDLGLDGFPALAIGDVDADGNEEIIAAEGDTGDYIRAYDLATGTLSWSIPHDGARNVRLAQLDADPALEIVVDGNPIRVIDGATRADEWSFDDGYYAWGLVTGHFSGTDTEFAVGREGGGALTLYGAAPYPEIWNVPGALSMAAIEAGDLDGDGYDEIVSGDTQWGAINVYDGRTHEVRLSLPHDAWGIDAVATVDLDGDNSREIVWAPRQADFVDDEVLQIVDGASGATRYRQDNSQPGPFSAVAIADLDGDGNESLFYGSVGTVYGSGSIADVDFASGRLAWQSPSDPLNGYFPYTFYPLALGVAHRSASTPVLIAAGSTGWEGRVIAIDGAHDIVWQQSPDNSGFMANHPLRSMQIVDLDGDGNDDIVACGDAASGNDGASHMFVLSSIDGAVRWMSPGIGSGFSGCRGVLAGAFETNGHPLIVAVMPASLEAYDAITTTFAWSLPVTADGATLLDAGFGGREIAVFSGSRITFYDAATHEQVRSFVVDGSVAALRELGGDIHRLLVAAGGKLMVIDGLTGDTLAASAYLGDQLGERNQLAARGLGGGAWRIAAGSGSGVFRFVARVTEELFGDGFER